MPLHNSFNIDLIQSTVIIWWNPLLDTYVFYTAGFLKLTSWAVWIVNFYEIIGSRGNVLSCCNVMSWRHIHGDGCLQTPIISDYQFNFKLWKYIIVNSGGSRISRRGVPWTPEAATFRKFCMSKWKNLDP